MNKQTILIGNIKATPLGEVWTALSARGLVRVDFGISRTSFERAVRKQTKCEIEYVPKQVDNVVHQIKEYLMGKRQKFDLTIDWSVLSSDFQRDALRKVFSIPYCRDSHLRRDCRADRTSASLSCHGTRQRNESDAVGHSLSSRHWHGRQTSRLRRQRRIEDQSVAVEDGKGKLSRLKSSVTIIQNLIRILYCWRCL